MIRRLEAEANKVEEEVPLNRRLRSTTNQEEGNGIQKNLPMRWRSQKHTRNGKDRIISGVQGFSKIRGKTLDHLYDLYSCRKNRD